MAINERRVAVLGAGTIGEALIAGLISGGWRRPDEIVATGRREERVNELREKLGVEATLSNADAVADAALIVIAVKPQDFDVLLEEIAPVVSPDADRPLGRCSDSDHRDRGASARRRSRRARDAERAGDRARGDRRHVRRGQRGRAAPCSRRGSARCISAL